MTPERKRCKGNVYRNNYPFPCDKLEWKDGYCRHHHPEERRKRSAARIKKKEELLANRESSILAEKDKEIAELMGEVLYWKRIAETPEIGKKTIEQYLEKALEAAKERIAELEQQINRP